MVDGLWLRFIELRDPSYPILVHNFYIEQNSALLLNSIK